MVPSRLPLRLTALLILVGCGEVVDTPNNPLDPNRITSGTRLKVRWYDYGSGTRATAGLYDAERKESCFYATWTDGKIYCMPTDAGQAVYTDKQCTQLASRVNRSACGTPPPAYLVESTAAGCSGTVKRLFQRGPQLAAMQYYLPDFSGGCEGPFSDADSTYYLPGTEVPASQLVALSLDQPDHTVRLSAPAYTSADGARFRSSMYDSQLETRCFFSIDYAGAGTGVCAPSSASGAGLYRDATCTLPVVDAIGACPAPQYAQQATKPECPSSPNTYYRVGASVALQAVYGGGPGSCSATSIAPGTSFYLLGDPVSLAPVSRVRDTAAGSPLQVIRYVAGSLTFRDGSLYDNTLGTECRTQLLADGTYRCIPSSAFVQQFFTNSTCTQTIDLVESFTGPAGCAAQPLPTYAARSLPPATGSCLSGLEMHMAAAEYTGPLFQNFGMCTALSTTGSHYYRLGPQLPLTQFQPATLVTDP
jgi:hypothetical protein